MDLNTMILDEVKKAVAIATAQDDRLYTKKCLAERYHTSVSTIDLWIASGELPLPKKLGRKLFWTKSMLPF
jgi:predicted DNA-binding transcriptional regulator AlpA